MSKHTKDYAVDKKTTTVCFLNDKVSKKNKHVEMFLS